MRTRWVIAIGVLVVCCTVPVQRVRAECASVVLALRVDRALTEHAADIGCVGAAALLRDLLQARQPSIAVTMQSETGGDARYAFTLAFDPGPAMGMVVVAVIAERRTGDDREEFWRATTQVVEDDWEALEEFLTGAADQLVRRYDFAPCAIIPLASLASTPDATTSVVREAGAEYVPEPDPAPLVTAGVPKSSAAAVLREDPVPDPESSQWLRPVRIGGYAAVGVGAIITGLGAWQGYESWDTRRAFAHAGTQRDAFALRARGERAATRANMLFGIGGALAAAGALAIGFDVADFFGDAVSSAPVIVVPVDDRRNFGVRFVCSF